MGCKGEMSESPPAAAAAAPRRLPPAAAEAIRVCRPGCSAAVITSREEGETRDEDAILFTKRAGGALEAGPGDSLTPKPPAPAGGVPR